jgi:hypothetical protein
LLLVARGNSVQRENRMSYAEFVWFLISEEDKKNPTRYSTLCMVLGDICYHYGWATSVLFFGSSVHWMCRYDATH